MHSFDFNAHKELSNCAMNSVQQAIELAIEKSSQGQYVVCVTHAGEVLVLPEFSASVRKDIAETVYDTDKGYSFSIN